jgi:hypothetical protein
VPVHDEPAEHVAELAASLPDDVWCVWVVNGSGARDDEAEALLRSLPGGHQVERITVDPRGAVGQARGHGTAIAVAAIRAGRVERPWVHWTDSDAVLPPRYFDLGRVSGDCACVISGIRTEPVLGGDEERCALYDALVHVRALLRHRMGHPWPQINCGAGLSIALWACEAMGGVPHVSAGEDVAVIEWCGLHGRVLRRPGAVVACKSRPTSRTTVAGATPMGHAQGIVDLERIAHAVDAASTVVGEYAWLAGLWQDVLRWFRGEATRRTERELNLHVPLGAVGRHGRNLLDAICWPRLSSTAHTYALREPLDTLWVAAGVARSPTWRQQSDAVFDAEAREAFGLCGPWHDLHPVIA